MRMEGFPVEPPWIRTQARRPEDTAGREEREMAGTGNLMELDPGPQCLANRPGIGRIRDLVVLVAAPELHGHAHVG